MESREKLGTAVEQWFTVFIREFRKSYDALPDESKARLSYLSDFRLSCHIIVFWAVDFNYQFVLVIKEPDLTSDSIRAYILGPSERMISQAAAALKESWFDTVAEPAQSILDEKYKKLIEGELLGVLRNLPQMRLRMPPRTPGR